MPRRPPAARTRATGGTRTRTIAFWLLLAVCTGLLIRPLWAGAIPPLTDFGGHLSMIDVWVGIETDPELDRIFERRDDILAPNLLAARWAELLYPAVDTLTALRLFVSGSLMALVGTLLWCARVFDRSRWLVFLAMPFAWGGMLGLGLVNYVAAMPTFFAAVALAHRFGRGGRWPDAVGLGLTACLAFLLHGIGFLVCATMALVVLVCSATGTRLRSGALALAPSTGAWLAWTAQQASELGLGDGGRAIAYFSIPEYARWFARQALDVLTGPVDAFYLPVLLALLLTLAVGRRLRGREVPDATPVGPEERNDLAWQARLRSLRSWARSRPLETLAIALSVGYLALPSYYRGVAINTRLVTPLLLTVALLPRPGGPRRVEAAVHAAGVLLCAAFGLHLGHAAERFHRQEVVPLLEVIDTLPGRMRVECASVWKARPVFLRLPLDSNCNALVQLRAGAFSGGGFADTPHNAIRFEPGHGRHTFRGSFPHAGQWDHWDYVIVRGQHVRPERTDARPVVDVEGPAPSRTRWTLYRVSSSERRGRQRTGVPVDRER